MGGIGKAPRRRFAGLFAFVSALAISGVATAHELDHVAPSFTPANPPSAQFNAGGPGAEWNLIGTVATGNPHTDLDFFTSGGQTFAAVGTLGAGPNAGGQTIVQLTHGDDNHVHPQYVSSAPTASCVSDPSQSLGLQHDSEAAPKGDVIFNSANPFAVRSDAQLVIDATDAPGRCHDQGALGLVGVPQGGLELIDVTDVQEPVEIGLTSHIGESHTVNVDPKRPHIAYVITSDAVTRSADAADIDGDGNTEELVRQNENPSSSDRFDLDGFEVVDYSSCMNFPATASTEAKRAACRPEVYRYRYPTPDMALGHTLQTGGNAIYACHEVEVYPNDLLTCGSGNALIALDMSGAFDDNGTPADFTDDHPRGTPLPCRIRESTSLAAFETGAAIADCVDGTGDGNPAKGIPADEDLTVPGWLDTGAPSLEGVRHLGSIHHQGRGAGSTPVTPAFDSTQDIDFDHEAELSGSGDLLIATDERGGGVAPPGASCSPGVDNTAGNGGVHFYDFDRLSTAGPGSSDEAHQAYARTPAGGKAIYRAPIRTQPQADLCTAHVFQQIPGQNRIFMGWYSQGTQVVDFVERPDGTVEPKEAGYFIPEQANEWVSHVFDFQRNEDGTFTYWGATGDFNLGTAGRSAIDVYEVTLPPPPTPRLTRSDCKGRAWMMHADIEGMPFASRKECDRSIAGRK
jgi:hypothetical protein